MSADGAPAKLPTVERDLSDSWIWGAASDPIKLGRVRAWQRLASECASALEAECAPASTPSSSPFYNASRLAIKGPEHTWGVSVSHYGSELDANWDNTAFAARRNTSANLQLMEASWLEQRRWSFEHPLEALGPASKLAARL
eukprot:681010-Prymnesium_polylepis.1